MDIEKIMVNLLDHIDDHKKAYKNWSNKDIVRTWLKIYPTECIHEYKTEHDKWYPYRPLRCQKCGYEP